MFLGGSRGLSTRTWAWVASALLAVCSCSGMSTNEKRAARGAATGAFRGQAAIGAAASTAGGYVYDKTVGDEKSEE